MSRFRLRVVDLEAGISRRALASGVCAAVEAEGGDEVFVEVAPDAVAGVDVGPIDPAAFAGPGAAERCGESGVVCAEPSEDGAEAVGEWSEGQVDGGELVEDGRVPVSYTHLRAHETPEHLVC